MAKLNRVMRRPADAFPNTAFARPNYREKNADAGTETILAFDGATTRMLAVTANP